MCWNQTHPRLLFTWKAHKNTTTCSNFPTVATLLYVLFMRSNLHNVAWKKNKKQFRSVVGVRYHICETLLQKLDSLKNWEDLKKSGKKAYLPLIRDGIWPVRICWLPVWWPSRCVLLYVDCTEYRRPDQTMIDHRYSTQQRKHRYRNSSGRTLVLPVKKKEIMKIKMFWHYYIILRPLY